MSYKKKLIVSILVIAIFIVSIGAAFFLTSLGVFSEESLSGCVYQYQQGNYQRAQIQCRREMSRKTGTAEYYLGLMSLKGLGESVSAVRARKYFLEASRLGNSDSELELASLFSSNLKWKTALYWYKKAEKKHVIAYLKIAEVYKILYKTAPSDWLMKSYRKYLQQAIKVDINEANVLLASDYMSGFGVHVDKKKAFALLRSYLNRRKERENLYTLSLPKVSYRSFAQMCYGILLYDVKKNYRESLKFLLEGYKSSHSNYLIAQIYYLGLSTKQDLRLSLKWYRAASVDDGRPGDWDAKALYALGNFYKNGTAVKKNQIQFIKLLKKASAQGSLRATEDLASFYESGNYVRKDISEAIRLYSRAKKMGSLVAERKILANKKTFSQKNTSPCAHRYDSIMTSRRLGQDIGKLAYGSLLTLCLRGGGIGNAEDLFLLGKIYQFGIGVKADSAMAFKYWKQAANKGSINARYALIQVYARGLCPTCKLKNAGPFTILPNPAIAEKMMLKFLLSENISIKQKTSILNYLGYGYGYGRLKRNLYKSYLYYRRSAALDNRLGLYNLAIIYLNGRPFLKSDQNKAIALLKQSAEKGFKRANAKLCYVLNHRVNETRYSSALVYCSRAAENGFKTSMYLLAKMYQFGLGTDVNESLARFWYQKSADLGYGLSKRALMTLDQ